MTEQTLLKMLSAAIIPKVSLAIGGLAGMSNIQADKGRTKAETLLITVAADTMLSGMRFSGLAMTKLTISNSLTTSIEMVTVIASISIRKIICAVVC